MTLGHVNSRNTGSKRVDKEGEREGERGEKRERRRGEERETEERPVLCMIKK